MKLVDAHCHLESPLYEGRRGEIIRQAEEASLARMITCAIEPGEWELSRSLSRRHASVAHALGIHPWYIRGEDFTRLEELPALLSEGAVAVGEIGLDRKTEKVSLEEQKRFLEKQLIIARETSLPVILHCRGAFDDLWALFKRIGAPPGGGIIHSFSGSVELAEQFMRIGLAFSMGGVLTYRNSRRRSEVLRRIYPDHFLLETDAPDIPPVEAREGLHVPANLLYNLRAASEILKLPEEAVAERTSANAARIFRLEL